MSSSARWDRARRAAWVGGGLALTLLPLVHVRYLTTTLTEVMIFALFAMSLGVLVGYAGLVSLGHAAFFGTAAYAVGSSAPA